MGRTVAVIGAGIAGPAAVLALARAGQEALWVAPKPEPDHDPVGETLAPAANPILAGLGLSDTMAAAGHRPSHTTLSAWGSDRLADRNAILHLEGPGLVLDRARFEADLRSRAAATAGRMVETRLSTAHAADGVWHLTLENGEALTADALVDASGRSAVVARSFAARERADQLMAAHAFLPHRDDSVEPTRAVLIEAVETGWWYAALRPDGSLSVAYFTDPDLLGDTPSRDLDAWTGLIAGTRHIGHWIEDAGFAVEAPPRLSSAGTTWLVPPAGRADGAPWMAMGDCAAAFDPLSSHGMTTALWAGARAGGVLSAALQGDDTALEAYTRSVLDGVAGFLAQRRSMYAQERRFLDAPFWQRRQGAG
jgi:2-polyprenyl-6-methoxyphenol hydroxylase-like FAD-dependent oxidoreductase